uniref:Uncharacterized protein n=1 Tax=Anguilla anguilla TaxID=7936 RepID=A0A0E9Y2E1_ANGAN
MSLLSLMLLCAKCCLREFIFHQNCRKSQPPKVARRRSRS